MSSIAVIGAGVVGLSTALNLQRRGFDTTIIDPLPAGSSASYGNAAMISVAATTPVSMPGMLRNLPKWLLDPEGPLFVNPHYFPKAIPWLWKWIKAGNMRQVRESSQGLFALHQPALDEYRRMLSPAHFDRTIQVMGQVHVWDTPLPSLIERVAHDLRVEQGIEARSLSVEELRSMVPDISPRIQRALFFPQNGHTLDPHKLAQTIEQLFHEAGGVSLHAKAMRILPTPSSTYQILTNAGDLSFDRVVVAAGAWSLELLKPLGVRFPLETERGYHVQVEQPGVISSYPMLFKSRGFSASPMERGLRFAGTVEIAGLHYPPDTRRTDALLKNAKKLFPKLNTENHKIWMGFRSSTPDTLPVLSQCDALPGLFIACGHGHTGLTAAATSGRLIAELVSGQATFIDPAPYRLGRF